MVKLEEVTDEDLTKPQVGPVDNENDWDDTDDSGTNTSLLKFSSMTFKAPLERTWLPGYCSPVI